MNLWNLLRLRPRLLMALLAGSALTAVWPGAPLWQNRLLLGWNLVVWIYLPLVLWMMLRTVRPHQVPQRARQLSESIPVVLLLAILGAAASLVAVIFEVHSARQAHDSHALLFALATISGSWLLLPVEFALAYASLYHRHDAAAHGLEFAGKDEVPDYGDFLYFSVTVAATSQTSDVAVSSRAMRRLVLLQSLLAFVFNTGVLALSINLLAGLIS